MNSQAATLGNVMRRHDEVADMQAGHSDVLQRDSFVAERDQDIRRVGRTLHRMGGQPAIDVVERPLRKTAADRSRSWPGVKSVIVSALGVCPGAKTN